MDKAKEPQTCCGCGKEIPEGKAMMLQIISPNWRSTDYKSPLRPYCSAECRGMDQMAHEG